MEILHLSHFETWQIQNAVWSHFQMTTLHLCAGYSHSGNISNAVLIPILDDLEHVDFIFALDRIWYSFRRMRAYYDPFSEDWISNSSNVFRVIPSDSYNTCFERAAPERLSAHRLQRISELGRLSGHQDFLSIIGHENRRHEWLGWTWWGDALFHFHADPGLGYVGTYLHHSIFFWRSEWKITTVMH